MFAIFADWQLSMKFFPNVVCSSVKMALFECIKDLEEVKLCPREILQSTKIIFPLKNPVPFAFHVSFPMKQVY